MEPKGDVYTRRRHTIEKEMAPRHPVPAHDDYYHREKNLANAQRSSQPPGYTRHRRDGT